MNSPYAPAYYYPPAPPQKKQRRVFMWFFLVVQAIFVTWIIAGAAAAHNDKTGCNGLSAKTCQDAKDAGAAIGVGLIIGLWVAVDVILVLVWAVTRLSRRR